jgi:sporulation and spore germination protein
MTRAVATTLLVAAMLLIAATASTSAPQINAKTHAVSVFAPRGASNDCARVLPLQRTVESPALLKGAMQALLTGPTKAERGRGYGGWFSANTAGHLRSVRILRGVAFIDFRTFARDIPNASTSCGSALLLAQLDRTAKQFATVERAVYSFDGSRRAFYEWLQRRAPEVDRRQ